MGLVHESSLPSGCTPGHSVCRHAVVSSEGVSTSSCRSSRSSLGDEFDSGRSVCPSVTESGVHGGGLSTTAPRPAAIASAPPMTTTVQRMTAANLVEQSGLLRIVAILEQTAFNSELLPNQTVDSGDLCSSSPAIRAIGQLRTHPTGRSPDVRRTVELGGRRVVARGPEKSGCSGRCYPR